MFLFLGRAMSSQHTCTSVSYLALLLHSALFYRVTIAVKHARLWTQVHMSCQVVQDKHVWILIRAADCSLPFPACWYQV